MSNYEQKPGTGAIFKNAKKEKDTHPDYTGQILAPDGKTWQIALWVKKSQKGTSYFSAGVSEPYDPGSKPEPSKQAEEEISDLPF